MKKKLKKVRGIEKLIECQKWFWDKSVISDKNNITSNLSENLANE